MKQFLSKKAIAVLFLILGYTTVLAQGTQVSFSSIPKSGTALVYAHLDDDLIWMLPFWNITEKFLGGAMPSTPIYDKIIHEQQAYLDANGYNINYESNWTTVWADITHNEYTKYYWEDNPAYYYLVLDHLETRLYNNPNEMSTFEINKIKAKLEQYVASPDLSRLIAHNNWGEYGHKHHKAVNKAVRELAVKYRKDVWMLGCDNERFVDVAIPNGITYTMASFNDPTLYTGIRNIYQTNNCWTWYTDRIPSGDHSFIKIVEAGVDKSNILTGESVTVSGPTQNQPGAYIFDGDDDYLTLEGNNFPSFTIAMRVRPDQIRSMDISKMTEYPSNSISDRNFYLNSDGRVGARIFDGTSKVVTSTTALTSGTWSHIVMTSNGSSLKIYVNGNLENTISAGTASTGYATPEFVLGQTGQTASFFSGQINDVQLFNYALTDNEVATLSGVVYTITANAGTGGNINPTGAATVIVGANKTYTITPNNGYYISDVKVDNISVGTVSTYTFSNVTTSHTISATFAPLVTYTITSSAGPGGSINPAGTVTVGGGTNQTFIITPYIGYRIADVTIDEIPSGAISTYTFNNIVANHTISVIFALTPTYTITSGTDTGGSINPPGTVTVNEGSNQTYIISPNTGYKISQVLVDNNPVGALSNYTFSNITSNHTISASFAAIPAYSITTSSGAGGSIDPAGTVTVYEGTNKTFTFSPNFGYQNSDIKVDNNSMGILSSYTFNNVRANHTIFAEFTPITFTITSNAGANGSISPGGVLTMNYGTSQPFSITPGNGFQVSDVRVDNNSIGAVSSYTFSNVLANHTISATFEVAKYTINGSAGEGGSITPTGIITLNHGTNQTYTITANTGYRISNVEVDNISIGSLSTYTFNNVTGNHTISATFSIITYTITGSSGTGGLISPQGAVSVNYGTNLTCSISANTGYYISDVRIDNVSVGTVSTYTFNNVTADHTLSATFSLFTYTITGSSGAGGSITPSGIITPNYGTNQTYTITPNVGYHISDVRVDNNSLGAVSTYTFSNITTNHTISATFAINTYTINGSSGKDGSINPAGLITLDFGTNRVYTITPDPGYEVSDVLVDNNSVGPVSTYTFNNIAASHTISATFSIITYKITASAGTGGSITPTGVVILDYGMSRTYIITPATGFRISGLKVDNISVDPVSTYTFNNVTVSHTISATFSLITYTIRGDVVKGEEGSISPAGTVKVDYGTNQIYTIIPETGYKISDIIVDNISMGALSSYTFRNVTTDHTIFAKFTPITFTITGIAGSNGSISTEGIATVNYGTNQSYTIIPDIGYQVSVVLVDGTSAGAPLSYTFKNITTNHTISATFTRSTYVVEGNAGAGGSISPAGAQTMYYGSNQTYTITPDNNYKISDVKVDNISLGPVSSYTFNIVTANHTISATFKLNSIYLITATAGIGGTISPSGTINLFEGANQSYTITPSNGYRIYNVKIDNTPVGVLSDYTFNDLMSDHIISASFTTKIEVNVYPNPFKDHIKISIVSPEEELFDISIVDMTQKIVFTKTKIPGNAETVIYLQHTPPGIYILKLYTKENRMTTFRIVKY